jgi:hypothetical protein
MGTTSIDVTRPTDVGVQQYQDAMFIRSDAYLYFGEAGDANIRWTGSDMRVTSTSDLRIDATNNIIAKVVAGVTRPTVSDAWYLKSDTVGGGFYLMVSSG